MWQQPTTLSSFHLIKNKQKFCHSYREKSTKLETIESESEQKSTEIHENLQLQENCGKEFKKRDILPLECLPELLTLWLYLEERGWLNTEKAWSGNLLVTDLINTIAKFDLFNNHSVLWTPGNLSWWSSQIRAGWALHMTGSEGWSFSL